MAALWARTAAGRDVAAPPGVGECAARRVSEVGLPPDSEAEHPIGAMRG